jgi:hypothetical protein
MDTPTISICIPTLNRARYLPAALASALRQTRGDFEIIVSDDASSDDTTAVVAAFDDARIRYVRNRRRTGIAGNRNRCLELARGRYIAWLDSDDLLHPEMLERQCAVLDTHAHVGLVHGAFHVIGESGQRLPDWPFPHEGDTIVASAAAFRELVVCNAITTPTVLIRRGLHDRVGPFDASIGRASTDWDMWLRIVLLCDVAWTAAPVASYRYHAHSISAATRTSGERLHCELAVLRRTFQRGGLSAELRSLQAAACAALAARAVLEAGAAFTAGLRRTATYMLLLAARVHPPLRRDARLWRLLAAVLRNAEYSAYSHSRALLGQLALEFTDTRFGAAVRRRAYVDPAWERELREIAVTTQRLVPRAARLLVIDKCDPTVLHLSDRRGGHFPDRRLMPDGYPRDDESALRHLRQLMARGADHLLIPSAAFWWLDHYRGLRDHLDGEHRLIWSDHSCKLYRLGHPTASPQRATTPATSHARASTS